MLKKIIGIFCLFLLVIPQIGYGADLTTSEVSNLLIRLANVRVANNSELKNLIATELEGTQYENNVDSFYSTIIDMREGNKDITPSDIAKLKDSHVGLPQNTPDLKTRIGSLETSINNLKALVDQKFPGTSYQTQINQLAQAIALIKNKVSLMDYITPFYDDPFAEEGYYVDNNAEEATYNDDNAKQSFYIDDGAIVGTFTSGAGSGSSHGNSPIDKLGRDDSIITKIDIYTANSRGGFSYGGPNYYHVGGDLTVIDIRSNKGELLHMWAEPTGQGTSEYVLGYNFTHIIPLESGDTTGFDIKHSDIVEYINEAMPDAATTSSAGAIAKMIFDNDTYYLKKEKNTSSAGEHVTQCIDHSYTSPMLPVLALSLIEDERQFINSAGGVASTTDIGDIKYITTFYTPVVSEQVDDWSQTQSECIGSYVNP